MYSIILSFITSFTLTFLAIPSIISVAIKKNLVDEPGDRRSHKTSTPSLGGIGIFAGTIFSIILWTPFSQGLFDRLQYILCAFIIIFLVGAKDDIDPIDPGKKLLGQIFAAGILVFNADVRLTSLYGIFGVHDIPLIFGLDILSWILSVFTILVIINAFNLIDGINGLSASIGSLISIVLGFWFQKVGHTELAIVAFSLTGALIAFLHYNITPAKIFMGDTGSLLVGLVCSILSIKFIELHRTIDSEWAFDSAPAVAIGILILPLFDTLRVFTMRIMKGKSPFYPDRSHIHHLLIDCGITHMQATAILVIVNILFIVFVVFLQHIGTLFLLLATFGLAAILTALLYYISTKRQAKLKAK